MKFLDQKYKDRYRNSLNKLDQWISKNGWEGYDPYDVRGTKLILRTQKNVVLNKASEEILKYFPLTSRKLLNVKPTINAKAMALFARGYLKLFRKFDEDRYKEKAMFCLHWLLENPSKGYSGLSWGYPFDWQSRVFIPKGTPSGVVTSNAAFAFLDAYGILKEKKYLKAAESCCAFILKDLNIDNISEDKICISYTPLDEFHVHNANLLSASVLLRTYSINNHDEYKETGLKAINFTMSHQNKNGSWYYWAPPDELYRAVDNYHTGFVLECLNVGRRALQNEFIYNQELKKGLDFYAKNLFLADGTPRIDYNSIYPIDIHSCAQGIITFCELMDFEPKYFYMAEKVADWSIRNMQDERGHFYYRRYKHFLDKSAYTRWGQAWMHRGLSYLI
jgi:hypothetical protein